MIRLLITIVIVLVLYNGARKLTDYYSDVKSKQNNGVVAPETSAPAPPTEQLSGVPAQFEGPLQEAQKLGALGLKRWLDSYSKYCSDPRLAAVELDYVQLISRDTPGEARRRFAEIRQRLPANSPLQARIKQMERTYQ